MLLLLLAMLSAEPCQPLAGVDGHLAAGKVFLLGELHGTRESPAFALALACRAARAEFEVVVGLELTPQIQGAVDAYLDSGATPADRNALLDHAVWQRSYQDGRNSRAMVELIDGVRGLRAAGAEIGITLFDASGAQGGAQRERGMAVNLLRSIEAAPEAVHVVLTGNMHSRTSPGTARNRDYEPMGYLVREQLPPDRLVSLDVGHGGGSAWMCTPECGVVELAARTSGVPWSIEIDDSTRPSAHQGWYHVGTLTASLPAVGDHADPRQSRDTGRSVAPTDDTRVSLPSVEASSPAITRLQGAWQAYQYGAKTWTIDFDGLGFSAVVGPDEWYEGEISVRPDESPGQIDFLIEDCVCGFRGESSDAIFRWDDEALVLATPQPGGRRPELFDEGSGQVVKLVRLDD